MPGKNYKKAGDVEIKSPFPFTKEGLDKLPDNIPGKFGDIVRKEKAKPANEMKGYQMSYKMVNKQGLKMAGNPAYKLDPTISLTGFDPNKKINIDKSKLSALNIPSINDIVNYDNESMSVSDIDINEVFRTKTYDDMRAEGASEEDINKAKAFNEAKYGTQNPTAAGKTNNQVLDSYNAVVNLSSIPQPGTPEVKGDAFTSYDKRQEIRQGKNVTGQSIRNKNKIRRAENRIEKLNRKSQNTGLDSKDIFGNKNFVKKQLKLQDKIDKAKIRKEGLEERQGFIDTSKSNYKKQIEQGINPDVGRRNKVTLQEGTKGSSSTPANPLGKNVSDSELVSYVKNKLGKPEMKPMQLSPKAINYFNKKKK